MSGYVPLHLRDDPDGVAEWETLKPDVPPWLRDPIKDWLRDNFISPRGRFNATFVQRLEMALEVSMTEHGRPLATVATWFVTYPEMALAVVDFALNHAAEFTGVQMAQAHGVAMAKILHNGRSVWQVERRDDAPGFRLVRSDLAEAQDAVGRLVETTDRPGVHLAKAWSKIAGLEVDANGAYDQAVRAVEAAAHPVITPKDERGQLGKIASAIKDDPSKWTFALGAMDTVEAMMRSMARTNVRHGTSEKVEHTEDEALAAVHTAIALVGYFTGGAIVRVGA
jgi:hypothetical protein